MAVPWAVTTRRQKTRRKKRRNKNEARFKRAYFMILRI
jgi:hypothetical protein